VANSDYLSAALLAAIKRRTFMPTAQIAFSDSDLLAMADEEQRTYVVPFLRGLNEEHLLYKKVYTLDGVTTVFPFPAGADGEALRTVEVTDASGVFIPWNRIEPGQEQKLRTGFYVDDESHRAGQLAGALRADAGAVLEAAGQADRRRHPVRARHAGQRGQRGQRQDAVPIPQHRHRHHRRRLGAVRRGRPRLPHSARGRRVRPLLRRPRQDAHPAGPRLPGGTDFTNCYVCLSDESPVPQLPLESHVLLAQRVACSVIEHRGAPNLQSAREELAAIRAALTELMGQRTQGAKRHIQNFFGPGWRRYRARRLLP
jgi:hypothetical protein